MKQFKWQLWTAFDYGGSYIGNIFFDFPRPVVYHNNKVNSVSPVVHQIHASKTRVSISEHCRENGEHYFMLFHINGILIPKNIIFILSNDRRCKL
jgi:hypothetical protein